MTIKTKKEMKAIRAKNGMDHLKVSIPFFRHKVNTIQEVRELLNLAHAGKYMTDQQYTVAWHYYVNHYNANQIQEEMDIHVTSVYYRLAQADDGIKNFHDVHQHLARHGSNSIFSLALSSRLQNLLAKNKLYLITEVEAMINDDQIHRVDRMGRKSVEDFKNAVYHQYTNPLAFKDDDDEDEQELEKQLRKLQKKVTKIEQATLRQQEQTRKIKEDIERLKKSDVWMKENKEQERKNAERAQTLKNLQALFNK